MLGSYTTADGLRRSARLNRTPPPAVYPEPIRLKKTSREAALAHAQRIVDDGLSHSARLNRTPPPAVYPEPIRLKKTIREAALAHAQRILDDCSPDVIVPSLSLIEMYTISIARHNALRDSSTAEELRAMADELCSGNPYLTSTDDWEHSHPSHKILPMLTLSSLLCEISVNDWRTNIVGRHTAVSDLLQFAKILVELLSTDQYDV
jgi:hypothetical protein